jgi:hypothetical protein
MYPYVYCSVKFFDWHFGTRFSVPQKLLHAQPTKPISEPLSVFPNLCDPAAR